MKKLFTLSFILLALSASSQVCRTPAMDHSRVIVGGSLHTSHAVFAGLFNARFEVQRNEIALIAGQPCISAYYAIYDEDYRLITCGKVAKVKAGEYDIVKVGRPADRCRVVFSSTSLIAHL